MKYRILVLVLLAALVAPTAHAFGIGSINVDKVISGGKQFAKAAKGITPAEEHYIGRAVAANILSRYPLMNNTAITNYVNKVGLTVASASDRPYTYGGYHFAVLNTDAVNAYACPGGIVFITKGLLQLTKNEDELAGVLAHEIAHVAHSDGIKAIKKSRWTKLGVDTAMTAGSHFAPGEAKALTNAFSGVVGDVTKKVLNNQYGKKAEKNADASGLGYMHEAGYDPNALVALLQQQKSRGMGKGSYLSMHAKPGQRIAWLERDIKKNGWGSSHIASTRTTRFERAIAKVR